MLKNVREKLLEILDKSSEIAEDIVLAVIEASELEKVLKGYINSLQLKLEGKEYKEIEVAIFRGDSDLIEFLGLERDETKTYIEFDIIFNNNFKDNFNDDFNSDVVVQDLNRIQHIDIDEKKKETWLDSILNYILGINNIEILCADSIVIREKDKGKKNPTRYTIPMDEEEEDLLETDEVVDYLITLSIPEKEYKNIKLTK